MSAAQEFIEQYGRAFAHADVDALVECFAFPVQVVSVAEDRASVSMAGPGDWQGVLEGLLGAYKRLRVADVVPLAVEVSEPIDAVAVVRVHWALQRENGGPVYEFTALYTLARQDDRLSIVAIAHDELPKLQAALRAP